MRGIIFLCLYIAACGDRDLEKYQSDRVAEEISRIESVAGVYDGNVIRVSDQVSMGRLLMELQPGPKITSSADRVSAQRQASLKGSLELKDQKSKFISFSDAYFDSTSNTFQANIPLAVTNSNSSGPITLDLTGQIQNGHLRGNIEVRGFPESRTEFNLQRTVDQTARPARVFRNTNAKPEGNISERWDATKIDPAGSSFDGKAYFTLRELDISTEMEFVQTFAPIKYMDAVVFFTKNVSASFSTATWDLRTGRLHAESKIMVNDSDPRSLVLDCLEVRDADNKPGWNCRYTNNGGGISLDFEFRKTGAE